MLLPTHTSCHNNFNLFCSLRSDGFGDFCLFVNLLSFPPFFPHSFFHSFILIALASPLFPRINKRQKVIAWVLDPWQGICSLRAGRTRQP